MALEDVVIKRGKGKLAALEDRLQRRVEGRLGEALQVCNTHIDETVGWCSTFCRNVWPASVFSALIIATKRASERGGGREVVSVASWLHWKTTYACLSCLLALRSNNGGEVASPAGFLLAVGHYNSLEAAYISSPPPPPSHFA